MELQEVVESVVKGGHLLGGAKSSTAAGLYVLAQSL